MKGLISSDRDIRYHESRNEQSEDRAGCWRDVLWIISRCHNYLPIRTIGESPQKLDFDTDIAITQTTTHLNELKLFQMFLQHWFIQIRPPGFKTFQSYQKILLKCRETLRVPFRGEIECKIAIFAVSAAQSLSFKLFTPLPVWVIVFVLSFIVIDNSQGVCLWHKEKISILLKSQIEALIDSIQFKVLLAFY